MPVLNVQTPRANVSLHSERLVVLLPGDNGEPLKSEVPLGELERAIFAENVHVSTPALCELLRRQIPVSFLAWNGRMLGSFEPPCPPRGASRLLQYRLAGNTDACRVIAVKLIHAKIANGRRLLQRVDSNHHLLPAGALDSLEARERDALRVPDLAALRGCEGPPPLSSSSIGRNFCRRNFLLASVRPGHPSTR